MTDQPTVDEAWSAVMNDVQAIAKTERNKAQGFNFRGVDTVVNAVGPAVRKHGVKVIPAPVAIQFYDYETKNGTAMRNATVTMHYTIRGPAGDTIDGGGAFGEASDAGDKSVSKAQSVAERVFLLQALMIPTDEPDPDSESHERAPRPRDELTELAAGLTDAQRTQLKAWRVQNGYPAPSQMTVEQRGSAVAYIKELVG